jgi:hypothetical protein
MNLEKFQHASEKGLSLVLEKHGTHDQKTHGNWATGASMGEGVASSILERVRENGGLSVNMVDGSEPTSGYMVAKGSQYGAIASEADFYDSVKGPKILADYMKKNKSDLATGKNYLGLWHNKDDGQVYLDISENIQDRETARNLGAKRDQISIWDVTNFAEIETGGTGNVGKDRGSETARHLKDDGRGNRPVRPATLGKIGKALKVIRFEAGLIPVLKHDAGGHDQASHGNWARGVTGEEDALINQMEGVGPSLDDLENALRMPEEPGMDDLIDFINNNREFYNAATEGIDERVEEAFQEAKYEYEDQAASDKANEELRNRLYEKIQEEMIDEHAQNDDGSIAQLWQEQNGSVEFNPEDFHGAFDEVYGITHEVRNSAGQLVTTLSSGTDNIYLDGSRLVVTGQVQDDNGNYAGEFQRAFFKSQDKDGNEIWAVEHDLFKMDDEYAGVGFGSKFIAQQEAWYVAAGIGRIDVGTAWDGARHWAKSGYDFDDRSTTENVRELLRGRLYNSADFAEGSTNRAEFDSLVSKMVDGYNPAASSFNGSTRPIDSDNFPIPNDFLMIGYADRFETGTNPLTGKPVYSWAGARLLENRNMKYQKGLSKEGRSITQGPIDRDGDGLVYDGTAREKPAPTVNSSP